LLDSSPPRVGSEQLERKIRPPRLLRLDCSLQKMARSVLEEREAAEVEFASSARQGLCASAERATPLRRGVVWKGRDEER